LGRGACGSLPKRPVPFHCLPRLSNLKSNSRKARSVGGSSTINFDSSASSALRLAPTTGGRGLRLLSCAITRCTRGTPRSTVGMSLVWLGGPAWGAEAPEEALYISPRQGRLFWHWGRFLFRCGGPDEACGAD